MQVETRHLTGPELSAAIAAYTVASRSGCSAFAYFGAYAILLPMIGGGLFAQLLRLVRVPESWAFPLGIGFASFGSLLLFLANRRLDARQREERETAVASLRANGRLRTYAASAEKVWEVTDYDHGPAYLVQVEPSRFVFISSFSPHIEAMGDLRRHISVSLAEPVGLILSASTEGEAVTIESQKLPLEDLEDSRGCPLDFAVLTPDELPKSWRLSLAQSA